MVVVFSVFGLSSDSGHPARPLKGMLSRREKVSVLILRPVVAEDRRGGVGIGDSRDGVGVDVGVGVGVGGSHELFLGKFFELLAFRSGPKLLRELAAFRAIHGRLPWINRSDAREVFTRDEQRHKWSQRAPRQGVNYDDK